MRKRVIIAVVVFGLGGLAHAQTVTKSYRADKKFAATPGGTLVLENPVGNVEITGGDGTEIEAVAITTIVGPNNAALEEGHRLTSAIVGGDAKLRVLRTTVSPSHVADWVASVDWSIKVPRLTNVKVLSQSSQRIRVFNINGDVHVKNFSGGIIVANVTANTVVDSVNGSIAFSTPQLGATTLLTSINGSITASVPADSSPQWVAETAKGDIRTNLPARGMLVGNVFKGTINGEGGPEITTATLMGNIFLLANDSGISGTRSVKQPPSIMRNGAQSVDGIFQFYTTIGDVAVPEILGSANIFTGAGEVQLPKVTGTCTVVSRGGPLTFGEVGGALDARTLAGDITVDRARRGGILKTQGGTIRVYYLNGPMTLITFGGDILVRRTTAPVKAQTKSGDIAIVIDLGSATETVEARTEKGNVVVHVPVNFSADVDATIITSDPDDDTFLSDLPGLSISKEQIGDGRTRVHATGKLNKGGEKLVLEAANGDIRITTAPPSPSTAKRKK